MGKLGWPCVIALSLLVPVSVRAETPMAHGTAVKPSIESVMRELQVAGEVLAKTMPTPGIILDDAKRQEFAPKAVPAARKMLDLARQLSSFDSPGAKARGDDMQADLLSLLAIFGDADASAELQRLSTSPAPTAAVNAKTSLLLVKWAGTHKDPAAQAKILTEAEALAKANPTNDRLASTLLQFQQLNPASAEVSHKAEDLAIAMDVRNSQVINRRKLRSLQGKPLVISSRQVDGSPFSTDQWKGKVVLVDFWATFCPTCREDMPQVHKAYAQYHDKGLEVVSVSVDDDASDLAAFLHEHREMMPWPQVRDGRLPGSHPLAEMYGVEALPTMLLIDRKGVVRSISAQHDFEDLIPKLLGEKAE